MDELCRRTAEWLKEAERVVVFTGAGISTESGIPDFRSPNGVWSKVEPVYFQDFLRRATARREYWRQKADSHQAMYFAEPNAGHRIIAGWEARGNLRGVITQNIDGLHQSAGSRNVLELHGTAREIACLDCQERYDADPFVRQFLESLEVPDCPACSGVLKHATISFGQQLDAQVIRKAGIWARDCDLFITIGSSLVVTPAADLPLTAVDYGARLIIINREPTQLDSAADIVIHGEIGATLRQINALLTD